MANHLPHPHIAEPGHPPQAGQWAPYETEEHDLYPAFIVAVGDHSPDGNFYNVEADKLVDGVKHSGEWLFDVVRARVLWIPRGPPWP